MAIASSTGAKLFVERRRLEWRAGTPIPPRSGWLRFRPPHDDEDPVIGYLAVLPRHRGQGYINDILNGGVAVIASTGVDHIRAATDLTNTPMGDAFQRNGWIEFERSINMTWPTPLLN